MDKITLELTAEQVNNLKVFLARVDLKGSEVAAFNDLVQVLTEKPKNK